MNVTIYPGRISGAFRAPESKSLAIRYLLLAALSGAPGDLVHGELCGDAMRMANCASALTRGERAFDCGESAATLRFMLCAAAALGIDAVFTISEGLASRPIEPLAEVLRAHGIVIAKSEDIPRSILRERETGFLCNDAEISHGDAVISRDNIEILRDDAEISRDSAEILRDGAGISRDGAEIVCDGAEIVCDGAEIVCDGAEIVCDGAKFACDGAKFACDCAKIARDGAGISRDGAEISRDGAGISRDGAGISRDGAEIARDCAEIARNGAGIARDGAEISRDGAGIARDGALRVSGKLRGGVFRVRGDISSQFISALLLAAPLTGEDCRVEIAGGLTSRGYVDMTIDAMTQFGVRVELGVNAIYVPGGQRYTSPGRITIEGDWSGAAAIFTAAEICGGRAVCDNLNNYSHQRDRAIVEILSGFNERRAEYAIDLTDIPDIAALIAARAAFAQGVTRLTGAGRLRYKECDRFEAICTELAKLGADISGAGDEIIVCGRGSLAGGKADARGDHRIEMALAAAALGCENPVTIVNGNVTAKSYPAFYEDMRALGANIIADI